MADNLSAAERLMQQHAENPLPVTVEDVPDEDLPAPSVSGDSSAAPSWAPTMTAKAAGKQKAGPASSLDTQSHDAFPSLGGPAGAKANVTPIWGGANGKPSAASWSANATPRSATPASGMATPTAGPKAVSIPGRSVESYVLEASHIMPRAQLRRPIPDIVKDINRKSRANITMVNGPGGSFRFNATGPQDKAQQALRDLVQQIGAKTSHKVTIPSSARAHIIGKQGSTIKAIQEKSGARVQLPKVDEGDDDEDGSIDVLIEGNALAVATARDEINKIAGERSANATTRLKSVPSEFYPFIAGPSNDFVSSLEANHGVQIRVPAYQPWAQAVPQMPVAGQRLAFQPGNPENLIQLAGERNAVQAARAEIERRVHELQNQLAMDQIEIPSGRHQFIIGSRGVSPDDFLAQTNCTIILPSEASADTVTVVGLADDLTAGLEKAYELAMEIKSSPFDVAKYHGLNASSAPAYSRDIARYLQRRKEFERLEKLHNVSINTAHTEGVAKPWDIFAREPKNFIRSQKEMVSILNSHPPTRLSTVPVDKFFHTYLRTDVGPRLQKEHGVFLVVPEAHEAGYPALLVYEGENTSSGEYQVPQNVPTQQDLKTYQQGLNEARKFILDLLSKQESVVEETIEVPSKIQDRLRKYIRKEQDSTIRAQGGIPVRVSASGTTVIMRGTASSVQALAEKSRKFVAQEIEDDKERGFVLKFDFPQKFANHLIGKGGKAINDLREEFDVDIQVQNGEVELKGPKAKAEKAKSHILKLAKGWDDETAHVLKIDPKFHRELIGAQGSQIHRLQDRYKVHINFPRVAKAPKDDDSVADAASDAGKPRRQQGADEVIIRGGKKGADEARDEIWQLFSYLKDTSHVQTVTVQQKQLPSLIGSGGSAMDELRQETGAKVDVPNERNEDENALVEIQIKGTKDQVAKAKKIIEDKRAIFEDTVVRTIEVDRKWHRNLIGPSGSTLHDIVVKAGGPDDRRLQARTIQFPKQDADGNGIKIEGRKDVVEKIVAAIEAHVAERESQVTEVLEVPTEKHRSLIGRGGETKRQLESKFNVSIDVPRQGSDQTGVKVAGLPADVEKAKEHIASLIKEQAGETVQIPRKYHHSIAENGQFFRRLRNDHKVTVDHAGEALPAKPQASGPATSGALPLITDDAESAGDVHSWNVVESISTEEGDIPWVLKGNPENLEKAKKLIASALEQAQKSNATGYLVLADPSTYRYVIGQGGSKVNSIRKQSGCKIQVPRASEEDAIEITGSKEGCEKAKVLILEAVREGLASRRD
ncbi:putative RNA binding effector protein Scp160 [Microdochium bolleyi]|uniref:Putative RNA binding effector protein Scp160 n=1 Tax=Microdochium bolleyi TaxID=196109 RepID=A0A136JHT8_9PEZI|nr:putative RNA binding effector protein Scp160 [Microdochium bolleyi]